MFKYQVNVIGYGKQILKGDILGGCVSFPKSEYKKITITKDWKKAVRIAESQNSLATINLVDEYGMTGHVVFRNGKQPYLPDEWYYADYNYNKITSKRDIEDFKSAYPGKEWIW